MADVVIDLGELPHGRQHRVRATSRRPRPFRSVLSAAAVLLIAMLTGAAHPTAPAAPGVIPARLGDMPFSGPGRYFIVSAADGLVGRAVQKKIISMYELPSARLLSRTSVVVTGAISEVVAVGDVILATYQVDSVGQDVTVALAAGTDRALWRRPGRLHALTPSGRVALFNERNDGYGAGPNRWFGIDLASGETRWSLEEPAAGATDLAPADGTNPDRLVTVTVTGRAEIRDTETGRVTAAATVPAHAEWQQRGLNIWIVDDLVLLGSRLGIVAYALSDLGERWRNSVDLSEVFVLPICGDVICLFGRFGGVRVLEPATGVQRWTADRWALAQRAGPYLLATGDAQEAGPQPLVVLDPADGRELGGFGTWQPVGQARPDGRILGVRERLGDNRVWYALLNPADLSVRVLGVAEDVSGDCEVNVEALVCRRLDASYGVWRPMPP